MKNLTSALHKHHQTLGLLCWLFIAAWTLSGLMHPIMSRLNPTAANFSAPVAPLALAELPLPADTELTGVRAFTHQGKTLLQLGSAGQFSYVDAHSLIPIHGFERAYAEFLARHFSGEQDAAITSLQLLTDFDHDYLPINRLLPVYRVAFDRPDGLRAYVDVSQGQLGTLVDDRKAMLGSLFRALHTWHWWPHEASRMTVMTGFLVLMLLVAAAGFFLYLRWWQLGVFRQQQRWSRVRKWHAHLSGVMALALVCFGLSGLLHLLMTNEHPQLGQEAGNSFNPISIALPPEAVEAQWVAAGEHGYWRLQLAAESAPAHHGGESRTGPVFHYLDSNGEPVSQDIAESNLALALAAQWAPTGQAPIFVGMQNHFSGEYGFVNKRLPVAKVDLQDGSNRRLYVQLHTRRLASAVSDADRIEGYSFAFLHKWHHLDFLGKDARDAILAIAALLIFLAASFGIYRFVRNRQPRGRATTVPLASEA